MGEKINAPLGSIANYYWQSMNSYKLSLTINATHTYDWSQIIVCSQEMVINYRSQSTQTYSAWRLISINNHNKNNIYDNTFSE